MTTPTTTLDVHYGHLCSVRVSRFDTEDALDGTRNATIEFQVMANKTRAFKTFTIRVPFDDQPMSVVRSAWYQLTGQDITAGTADTPPATSDPTAVQTATLNEIKEFVRAETEKLGINLTLDVI